MAASQYSLVSIERSFSLLCCSVQARRKRKNFCDYLSFGIFFCLLVQNFGPKFFHISCREDVEIVRVRGGVFCLISVFLFLCFTVFCFFLSHHQLERSLILVLWSLTKKFVKPSSLFFYNCKGGRAQINLFFSKSGVAARVSVMTSLTTFDVFLIRANR